MRATIWSPWRVSVVLLASVAALTAVTATPARAAEPWWHISGEAAPSNLVPEGTGRVFMVASDLGDEPVNGGAEAVTLTDKLPAGLVATGTETRVFNGVQVNCTVASPTVTCTFTGSLNPYESISIPINVKVAEPKGTATTLSQEVSVRGGGAANISATIPVKVGEGAPAFGVSQYELAPFGEAGAPATQAGSHPFELTTTLVLNDNAERQPAALPRDLSFRLPPGFIGNPNAVAQCTMTDFVSLVEETNLCPVGSVVGVATVTANEPKQLGEFSQTVPIFNLVPAQGEPARFGFEVFGKIPIVIDTSVRTGKNYEVVASVADATETAGVLSSEVTLWGVPGDPRHNNARGWECVAGGLFAKQAKKPCPGTSAEPDQPFLTLPTSCAADPQAEPVLFGMEGDSWAQPGAFVGAEYAWMGESGQLLGFEGCRELPFAPTLEVTPEEHTAATPTGLLVDVKMPQQTTLEADKLAEADLRDTTVTLPGGVELSPSAANGLEACSEAQIGFTGINPVTQIGEFTDVQATCPDGSKLGTVKIKTPLLSHELEGSVYLATPAPNGEGAKNPFASLVALYLVAEDPVSGVLVKLAGEGQVSEGSLQIATTFNNAPQVPFEELRLNLFGGPRASVTTPSTCGSYATSALFTPWSGSSAVSLLSPGEELAISEDCSSGGPLPFNPGFATENTTSQAGAFTNFDLELSRPDRDQALSTVTMHLPQGVAALLSQVELCSEAQAAASTCPAGSLVGEATAVAGLGPEPYVQRGGKVYITGPYGGAPFGLEIVTPADAGPFDLGYVTVRSKLYVNPESASVTIVSEALPTQLRGIPLQLKRVLVTVNRPGFEFNPTDCGVPLRVEGVIGGDEGASSGASSPYPLGGCHSLPFSPGFSAGAVGHGSKADGTTFKVTVTSGGVNGQGVAQAGIAKVNLQLPKQLSSRLPTLQKACSEAAFNADPASCDEGSVIGYATIHTPVLKNPLSGPAYLVSHGNAAFPDVEFVLQGEGIKLVLDGKTQIKNGITYSKFESTPDAPFTVFETVLPAGPHGVLTPNVAERKHFDLCGETMEMPTTIVGQNGATIEHDTKIAIEGCGAVKAAKARKLTDAQKLRKALAACRRRYKRSAHERQRCEKQDRKRYSLRKKASKHRHRAKVAHGATP